MSPRLDGKRHTPADLLHERTNFQFIERSWRWAMLSGTVVLISIAAFFVRGLNLGIDFEGGTSWQLTVKGTSPSAANVRDALRPLGLADAKVLVLGGNSIRVQTKTVSSTKQDQVTKALADYGHVDVKDVSVSEVGPTWGKQVSSKAVKALIFFFVLIAGYLAFRFEWKMAVAALIAVIHDIIVTAGVYAITGFEVTPATVVAFLTILGFSLYDTVVVFDKVKENVATLGTARGDTYSTMVNRSMNQVLMRSINTSFVAVLPVASLLFVGSGLFGAVTLRDFALALFVGLMTGAYSSIFVATPILAWWKEREPRYRALRERSALQLARAGVTVAPEPAPAHVGAAIEPDEPAVAGPVISKPTTPKPGPSRQAPAGGARAGARPPRPRQQRRRKRR
jgi:preprotein translocase subunit SecF